jgi:hypothetical protein
MRPGEWATSKQLAAMIGGYTPDQIAKTLAIMPQAVSRHTGSDSRLREFKLVSSVYIGDARHL